MRTAEVVIAGGGVVGCALAYQLARRGADVLVLERGLLGAESTAKCAGGVRQMFSHAANVRLQKVSLRLLQEFEAETGMDPELRQVGYLFVLTEPAQVADLRAQLRLWHAEGVTEARWVDPEEIQRLSPALNVEDVLGGTFCPSDGLASPAGVTQGYVSAARRLGARLEEEVALTGVSHNGGRVRQVETTTGTVVTELLLCCAGAWSGEVGRLAGAEVPVLPFRRHVFVTGPFPAVGRRNPMTIDLSTGFYFHPEGDGVLFGMGDREEPSSFRQEVDWDWLERVVAVAEHRAPPLAAAGLKTAWAGLYEMTPDHQPLLGPHPDLQGFWCACGFSGHGFMQAPAVGLALAQMISGEAPAVDLSAFTPARFGAGRLESERNVI